MKAILVCLGLLACCAPALAAEVRTRSAYDSPSDVRFGVAGTYQYDLNDFSNGPVDPMTDEPLFENP